ncbi:FtsK/SpoIIIE domain-containing protein [Ectobacillus panaciterrae]|uniref:FtsK/SpoIIIE domain-containing protein n=1 Tax=Ectobacillus panaciterrae TaxID=363872 RepID=UPI000426C222|nr:FtsK/SpoIIIE domain-containing protein [Ectobacillus panaciterrae]
MNEHKILSNWIIEIIKDYFSTEKNNSTDKLFLKINGFSSEDFKYILEALNENLDNLKRFYSSIIRTITPVQGFENFMCSAYETSTWLRNNTHSNQALILVINEVTPEAQSLENIFTIDEAYLLSNKGLDSLFKVLSENQQIHLAEIETLKTFLLDMLYETIDPQLRNLLSFLVQITESDNLSVVTKIQQNLPYLGMFRDSSLQISKNNVKKLKLNYYLSNLQSATSDLDPSKLQEKLYAFMEKEEKDNWPDEVWKNTQQEEFLNQANEFLSYRNKKFYFYEYNLIEHVFSFKVTTTLKSLLEEVYTEKEKYFSDEEKQQFLDGMQEVNKGENAEAIQAFIEEFEDVLKEKEKGTVLKKVNRLAEKLRNPSEYEDIYDALIHCVFRMVDEKYSEEQIRDSIFTIEILNSKVNEDIAKLLRIYLKDIGNVIPRFNFDDSSINETSEDIKDESINFSVKMSIGKELVASSKFKLVNLHTLKLLNIVSAIEEGLVPYARIVNSESEELVNVSDLVYKKVQAYLALDQFNCEYHFNQFVSFVNYYQGILKEAIFKGVFSVDYRDLEKQVEELLSNIYSSSTASVSIYKAIDLMCNIDYIDNDEEYSLPSERQVTLFNPIRLVAYLKRYEYLGEKLEEWINSGLHENSQVEKLDEYLSYFASRTKSLAPSYFTLGDSEQRLIEKHEKLGESKFLVNTKLLGDIEHLSNEVSSEVVRVVKSYLDVYPYAKDGLDVMLMHCNSSEIVTKIVDAIFKGTRVTKLNLAVHSKEAAKIHNELNKWIEQKEEYSKPEVGKKIPKLELSVISGNQINEIKDQVNQRMADADIVILVDYFAQQDQVRFSFIPKEVNVVNDWFSTVCKEPLNINENLKRISLVTDHLPKVLCNFYQMQYMAQYQGTLQEENVYLLNNIVTINQHHHNGLLDFMHDRFNWVMILDRYLDRTLLQKATPKAQIIQYKPKVGNNSSLRLIVSSSKYIRKMMNDMQDFDYYDRLSRKFTSILKVNHIEKDIVVQAVESVKDISGALVLKVIGKGKFSHEMLATYLTTNYRVKDGSTFSVWSLCDELPWFSHNQRRPDLVQTDIEKDGEKLKIVFKLIELKFVNHHIFDRERLDAIKQLKTGINVYERLFKFDKKNLDANYWRDQLVEYIVDRGAYSSESISLIKYLQQVDIQDIEVDIQGCVDVYCYTDNLIEYDFKKIDDGIYVDELEEGIFNFIFNRSYILTQLGINELQTPEYNELECVGNESEAKAADYFNFTYQSSTENNGNDTVQDPKEEAVKIQEDEDISEEKLEKLDKDFQSEVDNVELIKPSEFTPHSTTFLYPELIAFEGLVTHHENKEVDNDAITKEYIHRLKIGFNQNDIHISNERAIVGSSVIRIIFDLPKTISQTKVTNKSRDIQLWLKLNNEPTIFINKDGLNIDIVREIPETIYFNEFMQEVRSQVQDKVKQTNLIAPLGLDPLNKVIFMDFASPDSPHLLTGGTSGSGKSVTLNSIILGMMCLYKPEQLQFIFIDPKQVEFSIYEDRQHTQTVVTDINEAVTALDMLVQEMESRYAKFKKEIVSNLEEFVEVTGRNLPRLVVVFDEFADFMSQEKEIAKQVENSILRLGQKARAAGIHLVICTQNPKADIISTNIRNNLGARLALRATDATASSIILDESGAEKLAGKGDFLAKIYGRTERGKSPFLTVLLRKALLKYFER